MKIEQILNIRDQLKKEELTVNEMGPIELSALVGQVGSYWKLANSIEIRSRHGRDDKE